MGQAEVSTKAINVCNPRMVITRTFFTVGTKLMGISFEFNDLGVETI